MRYAFTIADVFSPTPFGGNQLAVITDARGLSSDGMQAVAREFNFAESTFVLPPSGPGAARRVRIFTPATELPFAGHPTVGTACVLVDGGHCPAGEVVLEEAIGNVAVAVERSGAAIAGTLTLVKSPELPAAAPAAADIATILSLVEDDIRSVFCASVGVPFTFAQLRGADALDRLRFDQSAWSRVLAGSWGPQLYLFAGELTHGAKLDARMFAPALGIVEDPATGSAVATLAGAAASFAGGSAGDRFELTVVQGVAMGRPSLLHGAARLEGGKVTAVEVGGSAAIVAQGEIDVPDTYFTD